VCAADRITDGRLPAFSWIAQPYACFHGVEALSHFIAFLHCSRRWARSNCAWSSDEPAKQLACSPRLYPRSLERTLWSGVSRRILKPIEATFPHCSNVIWSAICEPCASNKGRGNGSTSSFFRRLGEAAERLCSSSHVAYCAGTGAWPHCPIRSPLERPMRETTAHLLGRSLMAGTDTGMAFFAIKMDAAGSKARPGCACAANRSGARIQWRPVLYFNLVRGNS